MSAQPAALDHVLTVVAESPWAGDLVLRGSAAMPAWVGDAARPPGDLDWVLRPPSAVLPDDFHPYPYVRNLASVQLWPEAVHGAVRNEIWEFEEFDTGGHRPRVPPDGLHWIPAADFDGSEDDWDLRFSELIKQSPRSPEGIEFDPDAVEPTVDWDYADYDPGGEGGRLRLRFPWRAPDDEKGEVQIDLSIGERLPEPPVCTAVPRSGGRPPLGLWTATRELSLAWKLHWLAADQETHGVSAMKDLYDAVLLAALAGMHLRPLLQRVALPAEGLLDPARIRRWTIAGTPPGGDDPAPWLARLADATTRLL